MEMFEGRSLNIIDQLQIPSKHMKSSLQSFLFLVFINVALSMSAQWTQTNGPLGGKMTCVVETSAMYVGTQFGGVFKSVDNGENWVACNNGLTELVIYDLFATDDTLYCSAGVSSLFKSTDEGQTWTVIGAANYNIISVVVVGEKIMMGTAGGGVWYSANGGLNWTMENDGFLPYQYFYASKVLSYNGYFFTSVNGKLYRSPMDDISWTLLSQGLSENTMYFNINGDRLIAGATDGIRFSQDNGDTWDFGGGTLAPMFNGFLITCAGDDIYIAANFSTDLFYSNDHGDSWVNIGWNAGSGIYNMFSLGNGRFMVQTNDIDMNYQDGEGAQILYSNNNLDYTEIGAGIRATYCLSVDDVDGELFVGTYSTGLYSTSNSGASYENHKFYDRHIRCAISYNGAVYTGSDAGTYRTFDGGTTWENVGYGLTNASISDFARLDNDLFTATASGVFISVDGNSWELQSNGIGEFPVLCLEVEGDLIYAGSVVGLFVSSNFGNSWTELGADLFTEIYEVEVHNGIIYASTYNGLHKSTDGGTTWTSIADGLVSGPLKFAAFDNVLLAGRFAPTTTYPGVYASYDAGETWEDAAEGIFNNQVFDLAVSGDYVYASTLGSGVFKRPKSEFMSNSVENIVQDDFIFPNPVSDILQINLSNCVTVESILLLDVSGKLLESFKVFGNATQFLDLTTLPSGVYFVKINEKTHRIVKQ
jgi:photosystem II stability/assembly factor-like uncharacterized protein